MRRRTLLSVVVATALAGCGGRLGDDATTPPEPATDAEPTTDETTTARRPTLELIAADLVRSNEGSASELATVTGTVRNLTDETVAEVTATATFEDGDGEPLDRATASASDLSPGREWSFELVYPGTGDDARAVADYSLDVAAGD